MIRSIPFIAFLSLFFTGISSGRPTSRATGPVVTTTNGTLVGIHSTGYDQDFFLNIPYAAPPVEQFRFNSPQPYESTYENRDASSYGPACFGYNNLASISQVYKNYSEDCLQLNIVRPTGASGLPVVVWIHGGGFQFGSGIDTRYNTSYMVQQSTQIGHPIIGITINYRLAGWGYLASQEILDDQAANAGIKDQRRALGWIHDNVAAFGGDPNQVTLMGESAGAVGVGYQLLAYGGNHDNLFHQAIMESGTPFAPFGTPPVTAYQPLYNAIVKAVGCSNSSSTLACIRTVPSSAMQAVLATAPFNATFNPLIDGTFLPQRPSLALAQGAYAHVPIIVGTNNDEGTIFAPSLAPTGVHNDSEFEALVRKTGALTQQDVDYVDILYPNDPSLGAPYGTGNDSAVFPPTLGPQFKRAASYTGDVMIIAPKRKIAQIWSAANLPAFTYRFATLTTSVLPNILFGVYHTSEISFVFHNLQGIGYSTGDPFANQSSAVVAIADQMCHSWISFIATGNPNTASYPSPVEWQNYSVAATNVVFMPNNTHVEKDDFRADQLNFINAIPDTYSR